MCVRACAVALLEQVKAASRWKLENDILNCYPTRRRCELPLFFPTCSFLLYSLFHDFILKALIHGEIRAKHILFCLPMQSITSDTLDRSSYSQDGEPPSLQRLPATKKSFRPKLSCNQCRTRKVKVCNRYFFPIPTAETLMTTTPY